MTDQRKSPAGGPGYDNSCSGDCQAISYQNAENKSRPLRGPKVAFIRVAPVPGGYMVIADTASKGLKGYVEIGRKIPHEFVSLHLARVAASMGMEVALLIQSDGLLPGSLYIDSALEWEESFKIGGAA